MLPPSLQVLYLVEPVDEYCIQSLPEFEGKKLQNVAKEGLKVDTSEKAKERKDALSSEFEPLLKWLKDSALNDKVGLECYNLPEYRSLQISEISCLYIQILALKKFASIKILKDFFFSNCSCVK